MQFTQLWFRALVQLLYPERGRKNETSYTYSIINPPILVAKPNQQKGGGGIISSEYGIIIGALDKQTMPGYP